ncbi:hypothetical protein LIER_38839 [Lithospermum erythrorhizon]|uniref:Retrotransposon gag domain-containing protein n=1 Tax=Lithospermum erythrorhizon TaxID=34254 RepID=A0AAV3Q7B2_LITER
MVNAPNLKVYTRKRRVNIDPENGIGHENIPPLEEVNNLYDGMKEQFMFTSSAQKLWDEVISRYGVSNGPMLYQLKREITFLSQGSMYVVVYYSKLKRLWDELNKLEPLSICKCIAGYPCNVIQDFLKK